MASLFFPNSIVVAWEGDLDWEVDTIKALLVDTAPTDPDFDFRDDLSTLLYDGSYTHPTVGSCVVAYDGTDNRAEFTSATITFSSVAAGTGDAVGLVLYKDVGTEATDPIICYNEFSSSINGNGGDITVACPTNGWFYIS